MAVFVLAGERLAKLVELVAHLRGPDGCAWDRAQSYDSMKGLLLEEAYEVIDALIKHDFDGLEDELGDLLFQVVFYARLAEEEQRFTLDDVIERLHAKLVRRHPHVFGEIRASSPEEALASWLTVKEREREAMPRTGSAAAPCDAGHRTTDEEPLEAASSHTPGTVETKQTSSLLDGIPEALPSTLEAYELGVRAAEVGFDWENVEDLLDKVSEEVTELRRELATRPVGNSSRLEEEVGDLLFAASNLARYLGSDPESCLRRANQKFRSRFQALEQEIARLGKRVRNCTAEELDRLWNVAKSRER